MSEGYKGLRDAVKRLDWSYPPATPRQLAKCANFGWPSGVPDGGFLAVDAERCDLITRLEYVAERCDAALTGVPIEHGGEA